MTGEPSTGPASAYPMFRTPASICFSGPNELVVRAPVGAEAAVEPAPDEHAATDATEAVANPVAKARENALLLSTQIPVQPWHRNCRYLTASPHLSHDAVRVRHLKCDPV